MKVIGINGSPRKKHNTATVLEHALEGAKSKGAETELINLYDYKFQGCISCLACKLKTSTDIQCVVKDEATGILNKMVSADAIIFGSPIYFGDITANSRALLERFMFAPFKYSANYSSRYDGNMKTGFIYTMNVKEDFMQDMGYLPLFERHKSYLSKIYGHSEYMTVNNTKQVNDYSKYSMEAFDPEEKEKVYKEIFPKDCDRAFNFGASLID